MNLCRCEQGHFYDKEKYSSCPHCTGGSSSDDKRTEAFTGDFTDTLTQEEPVSSAPASMPVPEAPQMPGAPSVAHPLNIPGMSASQVTVTEASIRDVFELDEDSDHTVGIYDDVFSEVSGVKGKPSAKAAVSNKVDTPCVGWLVALGGEHIGTDFRLKIGKNFIGRNPQMDVALTEDKSVSRESHAIVVYEPRAHLYLVQPGESSSLVYRNNDVVLTPTKLEAYDMITVGDINLLFMPLCGERFNWGDLLEEMKKKDK